MTAHGRRSKERLRHLIDEEALDFALEQAKERDDARCGTALTDLTDFHPQLLRKHDLLPVDERIVRCGTSMAEAKVADAPITTLNMSLQVSLTQH